MEVCYIWNLRNTDRGVAMRKDYHMHPTALLSSERMEQFVQAALHKGIEEICVTDHMPLSISNAADRIPHGKVGEYCRKVRELAEKYADRICIRCGIEVDFHSSVISEVDRVLEEGNFDFILASSHMHLFLKDYPSYTFNDFSAIALENSIRAAETGSFHALSHMDMYRFVFDNPGRFPLRDDGYDVFRHKALILELLEKMAAQGMYLEINPHLAEARKDIAYTYPEETVITWAAEKGVRFSYGSDAHAPSSVGAYLDELERHPVYKIAMEQWGKKNEADVIRRRNP